MSPFEEETKNLRESHFTAARQIITPEFAIGRRHGQQTRPYYHQLSSAHHRRRREPGIYKLRATFDESSTPRYYAINRLVIFCANEL